MLLWCAYFTKRWTSWYGENTIVVFPKNSSLAEYSYIEVMICEDAFGVSSELNRSFVTFVTTTKVACVGN